MELRPFGTLTIVTDPDGLFMLGTTSAGKRIIQELKSVQLDEAFRKLPRRIVTVKQVHELTVYLVALGAVLALGAVTTSRWWNRVT